jgi:hypothetical protein
MKSFKSITMSVVLSFAAISCASEGTSDAAASSSTGSALCTPTTTLSGTQTASVTIPADACYGFNGLVKFNSGTTLTIGAGARLLANPGVTPPSSIIIDTGATINATGTAAKPIVFTSGANVGSRKAQDWGGLVIRSNAQTNHTTQPFTTEFDDNGTYGLAATTNDAGSSGTLTYVRVEFGAKQATSTKEYNGFSFEAVGSGTTIDHIHSHMNADDGVEFFGGTVNVKHVIVTGTGDDGFDWTFGWKGKAQFVIVAMTNGDASADSNGIEADNSEFGDTLTPYSNPTLYNFTLVSNNKEWRQIMRLRRGTKSTMKNFYVANWCDTILVESATAITNVTNNELKLTNSLFEGISRSTVSGSGSTCTGTATTDKTSAGILNTTGFDGFLSDATVTANTAVGNGFTASNWTNTPPAGAFKPSAAITTNAATPPNDGFFDNTAAYIGAVGGTDWTTWTAYAAN